MLIFRLQCLVFFLPKILRFLLLLILHTVLLPKCIDQEIKCPEFMHKILVGDGSLRYGAWNAPYVFCTRRGPRSFIPDQTSHKPASVLNLEPRTLNPER